ncbi:MAG TPA: hypothetical protein VKC60_07840 [Opitutaceae bacterium]|nr:hypothetical protein [Opitutaceae bacterium]
MSKTLGQLLERNVLGVFGERDSERRKLVINGLYTENRTFFEADEQIIGRDALNAKVEHILKEAPGFVFRLGGPAEVNHDHGHHSAQDLRRIPREVCSSDQHSSGR